MNDYLIWILIAVNIYLFLSLRKEKKRLFVLINFVGGLITFVSKTPSMIKEMVSKDVLSKEEYIKEVKGYEILMEDIKNSFENEPYEGFVKFVESNRSLFGGENMGKGNGGFNKYFLDFLDRCKKMKYGQKIKNEKERN